MEFIILGFCIILIGLYGYKAVLLHRGYSTALYASLFSSFLEYFFRHAIRHDCSTSNLVTAALGTNRMSFTTIQNHNHQVTSRFVLLFYNKGIACISYLDSQGSVKGKLEDPHWMIQRGDQAYKIVNPMLECKQYAARISKLCPTMMVQEYVVCTNDTDLSKIAGVYHYDEILAVLKAIHLPYIADDNILKEYNKLVKGRE